MSQHSTTSPLRISSLKRELSIIFPDNFVDFLQDVLPIKCRDYEYASDWTPWFTNFFYDVNSGWFGMDVLPVSAVNPTRHFRLGFQKRGKYSKHRDRVLRLYRNPAKKPTPKAVGFVPLFAMRHLDPNSCIRFKEGKGRWNCGRVWIKLNGNPYETKGQQSFDFGPREIREVELLDISENKNPHSQRVSLEEMCLAIHLEPGLVIGKRSSDNRRLTAVRITEGDIERINRILFPNVN